MSKFREWITPALLLLILVSLWVRPRGRWEYFVGYYDDQPGTTFTQMFNERGTRGWELVSATKNSHPTEEFRIRCNTVFKRRSSRLGR